MNDILHPTKEDFLRKTNVSPELKLQVETVVLNCLLKAQHSYGPSVINQIPEIQYTLHSKCAGEASYNNNTYTININPVLLNENIEEMLNDTVPHEMAHIVVFQMYYNHMYVQCPTTHGHEWKSVMYNCFGILPSRTHHMDTSSVKVINNKGKTYQYKCGCKTYEFTKNRHSRVLDGSVYVCRLCHQEITFSKIVNMF